ncbi:MAG: helix-turn-helix domain-containing protein [Clostridiales bacterium]|nr:helix-turn-helix domain-containing protein [Clostridiales bacterium]
MDGWICPEIDKKATGKRIRRRMKVMGISVKDIQSYLGLSCVQSVYHWLEGMSMPTVDNMYALSELLQVSVDTLLVGNRSLREDEIYGGRMTPYYILTQGELRPVRGLELAASFTGEVSGSRQTVY